MRVKTVAARIIILMLFYAVIVTSLIVAFSYYIVYTNQRRSNIQSAESNLRLASQSIDRDLVEVIAMAGWCSRSNPPARFLTRPYDPIDAVSSFMRLREEYRNSRAARYIRRILVISSDGSKVLHLSDSGSDPLVLPGYSSEMHLKQYELGSSAKIYGISPDPYSREELLVLNVLAPVYSTDSASATAVTGLVYIAVDVSIITDSLIGYETAEGSELLLAIDEEVWKIEQGRLSPVDEFGDAADSVNSEIRPGIFLTQILDAGRNRITAGNWAAMLTAVCLTILLLSYFVIWMMNRTISRPVARIRRKAEAIANGDFSRDESIESDSEIGEVGRSINRLSRNIVELMETRLADEQNKRELEYRMLQGQINPHFLYNTLGSIKWMAALQKAAGIEEMVTALSRLLRTTAKDLRKVVPLRDEIVLLDDYYTILKYRYGNTIQYEKRIEDDALLNCMAPRFVLQPLMENAIFHGIEPKGRGRLELAVSRAGPVVRVSVTDDGVGLQSGELKKLNAAFREGEQREGGANGTSSIGLLNVHRRIQNVFGAEFGLSVESEENQYTRAVVLVPLSPEPPKDENGVEQNV